MTHDKFTETEVSLSGNSRGAETYTRDYWLRLYAGMALMGLCARPNGDGFVPGSAALYAKEHAQALVADMFGDEDETR